MNVVSEEKSYYSTDFENWHVYNESGGIPLSLIHILFLLEQWDLSMNKQITVKLQMHLKF